MPENPEGPIDMIEPEPADEPDDGYDLNSDELFNCGWGPRYEALCRERGSPTEGCRFNYEGPCLGPRDDRPCACKCPPRALTRTQDGHAYTYGDDPAISDEELCFMGVQRLRHEFHWASLQPDLRLGPWRTLRMVVGKALVRLGLRIW